MVASGVKGTYDEIVANKNLVNEFKVKLIGLKSEMAGYIKQVKDLTDEVQSNINSAIEQFNTATAYATSFVPGGYDAAATSYCKMLAADSAKSSASTAGSIKSSFMSVAKTLTGQSSNILSVAASLGIGVPPVFLETVNTLATLKSTISSIEIPSV